MGPAMKQSARAVSERAEARVSRFVCYSDTFPSSQTGHERQDTEGVDIVICFQ